MIRKIPTKLETHGHVRVDDYYWLRERENSAVIQYLNDENEYAAKEMAVCIWIRQRPIRIRGSKFYLNYR